LLTKHVDFTTKNVYTRLYTASATEGSKNDISSKNFIPFDSSVRVEQHCARKPSSKMYRFYATAFGAVPPVRGFWGFFNDFKDTAYSPAILSTVYFIVYAELKTAFDAEMNGQSEYVYGVILPLKIKKRHSFKVMSFS